MMNKFKLFLILIVSTFVSLPKVNAIVNLDGSVFTQSPQLEFFDNTNGILTSAGSSYYSNYGYWISNNNLITTGSNTNGVNVTFTANEGFVAGYTYSLSILIATESSRARPSDTRICTAENIYNANTRFQHGYPCTNAISITSMDGTSNFDFGDFSSPYTILTYVFIPDFTSPTITLTYNTVSGNNSKHLFGGYSLTVLSDNKTGVSASQVQSIIDNSGLASADSVEELQTEIENVKEDINDASNAIVDSNKETQDVIKDQFNNCKQSINLINLPSLSLNVSSNRTFQYQFENYIPAGTYTFSYDYAGINDPTLRVDIRVGSANTNLLTLSLNGNGKNTFTLNEPFNKFYFYITSSSPSNSSVTLSNIQLQTGSVATEYEPYAEEICTNRIDETNDKLNDLNDNITSSDTSSSEGQANSFFEGFESDDYGLSDIITMPLDLIKGLTSNSCVALNLTIPFVNKNFQLPCMSSIYQQYFGDFFTLYQTITFGFIAYWVIVKIFALVKGFKDPNDDKVEVLDL